MRTVNIPGGNSSAPPDPPAPGEDPLDPNPPTQGGVIVYDCEIKNGILNRGEAPIAGIEYCKGWRDFENMGISLITAYDFSTSRYRIFMDDNLWEFARLVDMRDIIVGFNNNQFDNQLVAARNIIIPADKSADLLSAVWQAAGQPATWAGPQKSGGYGLDALYRVNMPNGRAKCGHGAMAPVLYQQGKFGELIDYGLNDTQMTVEMIMLACANGTLINPKDPDGPLLPVRDFLPVHLINLVLADTSLRPANDVVFHDR